MRKAFALVVALTAIAGGASARPLGHEAQSVVDLLLAPPTIKTEPGFRAKMLVQPGELYDPLFVVPHDDLILLNDDGKAIGDRGSRLLSLTLDGGISVLMGPTSLHPITAFDVAPASFGKFAGQVFALVQPHGGITGANANHLVERIDLRSHSIKPLCTLPTAGSIGNGIPGLGTDARFGPPHSPFADAFYPMTVLNAMIYRSSADGVCKPFSDLSKVGSPQTMAFTSDGSAMLVTVAAGEGFPSSTTGANGVLIRVRPDGAIDPKPVATGFVGPSGIAIAPPGFGKYAGQIFVSEIGDWEAPVPQTQALKHDGKVYRITPEGKPELVASGFINPTVIRFIGNHLLVTDVDGDIVLGMRELPDGFVAQIDAM